LAEDETTVLVAVVVDGGLTVWDSAADVDVVNAVSPE
jgi:hypothetical protein